MVTTVLFTDRPEVALEAAHEHLVSQPVVHNLVLSLLQARAAHFEPGRYWVAAQHGRSRGVVFQSPEHFRATITPMADDVVDAMVGAVVEAGVRAARSHRRGAHRRPVRRAVDRAARDGRRTIGRAAHLRAGPARTAG
ncbi:MAG: hypothetical protein M3450_08185 [Actinomycetota bacterium]|nr:hypothetical protein [Actinomycetota bacterium]